LLAAVQPQRPTHSYFNLFSGTTKNLAALVLFGACGEFGPDLAVAIGEDGAASVGSQFDLDFGRQGICKG
jgi:hypothetical protein